MTIKEKLIKAFKYQLEEKYQDENGRIKYANKLISINHTYFLSLNDYESFYISKEQKPAEYSKISFKFDGNEIEEVITKKEYEELIDLCEKKRAIDKEIVNEKLLKRLEVLTKEYVIPVKL